MAIVYIETSIVSHATSRASSDLSIAACSFARPRSFLEVFTMPKNPFLEELRQTREKLLDEAGGTIEGLVAQLQRDERQSGRTIIRSTGRKAARTGTAGSAAAVVKGRSSPPGNR